MRSTCNVYVLERKYVVFKYFHRLLIRISDVKSRLHANELCTLCLKGLLRHCIPNLDG